MARALPPIVICAALVLAFATGCNHATPYVRGPAAVPKPAGELRQRVVFFGDGGEASPDDATLELLVERSRAAASRTLLVFLGDNIYPAGVPESYCDAPIGSCRCPVEPGPEASDADVRRVGRLRAQLEAVRQSGADAIFLPGNHDYDRQGPDGWCAVRRQSDFISRYGVSARMTPADGDPYPVVVDRDGVRLVALDTQWWVHGYTRAPASEAEIVSRLDRMLGEAPANSVAMVAGHHPFASIGQHGGHYTWQDHIFPLRNIASWMWLPLPVVGTLYPAGRWAVGNAQDLSGPRYRAMARLLGAAMNARRPLLYAAGHEHNLQVLRRSGQPLQLVSGAGSKRSPVWHDETTLFAYANKGFMEVDVYRDGGTLLRVLARVRDPQHPVAPVVFSRWLRRPPAD